MWPPHGHVWVTSPTRVGDVSSDCGRTTVDSSGCGVQKIFLLLSKKSAMGRKRDDDDDSVLTVDLLDPAPTETKSRSAPSRHVGANVEWTSSQDRQLANAREIALRNRRRTLTNETFRATDGIECPTKRERSADGENRTRDDETRGRAQDENEFASKGHLHIDQ